MMAASTVEKKALQKAVQKGPLKAARWGCWRVLWTAARRGALRVATTAGCLAPLSAGEWVASKAVP
jgi:hypothetical protein